MFQESGPSTNDGCGLKTSELTAYRFSFSLQSPQFLLIFVGPIRSCRCPIGRGECVAKCTPIFLFPIEMKGALGNVLCELHKTLQARPKIVCM